MSLLLLFGGAAPQTFLQTVAGTLSFAGDVPKQTQKPMFGSIAPSGALATIKVFLTTLAGSLSFSGSLVEAIGKILSGNLSFSGSLADQLTLLRTVSGGVSFAGSATKQTSKVLPGASLSFSGALAKMVGKKLDGTLSFAGNLLVGFLTSKTVIGALSFIGNLAEQFNAGGGGEPPDKEKHGGMSRMNDFVFGRFNR